MHINLSILADKFGPAPIAAFAVFVAGIVLIGFFAGLLTYTSATPRGIARHHARNNGASGFILVIGLATLAATYLI